MIPFLDLAADLAQVEADARRRIDGVLTSCQYVLGPETAELEDALRRRFAVRSAIAVSSGTDALSLSLLALGVGAGDAVLLPAFTFFATAGTVARAGAKPVFCDIEHDSYLASARTMRAAIDRDFHLQDGLLRHRDSGAKLALLLPVHLYGRACDLDAILELARETGTRVIEDAAQAIDCRWRGRPISTFGDAGCLSFYPTKNLGGAGDGGMVVCNDEALGAKVARLRNHGAAAGTAEHAEAGFNARMPELVAAVLNAKLPRLAEWTQRRREIAALYTRLLADAARGRLLELSATAPEPSQVWHQYAVRVPGAARRDRVQAALDSRGIATRIFYPLPLHRQPCFATGKRIDFPEADAAAAEVLCLPIYPSLSDAAVVEVAEALLEALGRR